MLAQSYANSEHILDSKPLRIHIDNLKSQTFYCHQQQQDVTEFLNHLFETSQTINNNVIHFYTISRRCTICGNEHRETLPNFILNLEVLDENSVTTLKELYESQINVWKSRDSSMCSNCGQECMKEEMYSVSNPNNLLIVSLGLWKQVNNQIRKKIVSLKNVPKDVISVSGSQYKVTAAIFHHGPHMQNGHYTAMLRKSRIWIKADDEIVLQSVWPRYAKDAYVFICSKI